MKATRLAILVALIGIGWSSAEAADLVPMEIHSLSPTAVSLLWDQTEDADVEGYVLVVENVADRKAKPRRIELPLSPYFDLEELAPATRYVLQVFVRDREGKETAHTWRHRFVIDADGRLETGRPGSDREKRPRGPRGSSNLVSVVTPGDQSTWAADPSGRRSVGWAGPLLSLLPLALAFGLFGWRDDR